MRPVAQIAQSVEQGIENPRVGGSIPSLGTTNTEKPLHRKIQGFFLRSEKMPYLGPLLATKIHQHTVAELDNSARNRDELAFMSPHTSLLTIFP
jgi:hypothetical protein